MNVKLICVQADSIASIRHISNTFTTCSSVFTYLKEHSNQVHHFVVPQYCTIIFRIAYIARLCEYSIICLVTVS